jgi:hypothetical protein
MVSQLERAACKDLCHARLTLGLYGAILGDEPSRFFPGYIWSQNDVNKYPVPLRPTAVKLLKWGQNPGAVLNQILISRVAIIKAVRAILRRSPHGRKCLKVVSKLRKQCPIKHTLHIFPPDEPNFLETVSILKEAVDLPLTDRTMRLVRAFKPSLIQIATHNEPLLSNDGPIGLANIRLMPDGYTVEYIQFTVEVEPPSEKSKTIRGLLYDHAETGTEGVMWAVIDDSTGYDGLHIVKPGDHLTVLDQVGRRLWSGVIRPDRKAGWRRYPLNPKYGQPLALGHWVHWTQKGFKPDDWAGYFIRPKYDRLHGILKKSKNKKNENVNFLGPTRAPTKGAKQNRKDHLR